MLLRLLAPCSLGVPAAGSDMGSKKPRPPWACSYRCLLVGGQKLTVSLTRGCSFTMDSDMYSSLLMHSR